MPKYTEQVIWTFSLIALFFMDVTPSQESLCLFKHFGFEFCPGCGLGHSIYYALHFDLIRSVQFHILGPFATMAILFQILKPFFSIIKIKLT
ncbi:DUF2752 domain-containing protein [Chitinophagaceae bacterium LB-8]|uniref:DUF2752 domain-containing protein n=1 Tax=Paraflavisolibacter caeni TaxID=2982496 RepID=A0A9X2XXI3_9BACT|nr:DUF2752 domain-containing protein [Paraflavisolibacter caeni]MCU7550576.1 DUF2752 domain-containing protein [Paraflavisolibacter caeni]